MPGKIRKAITYTVSALVILCLIACVTVFIYCIVAIANCNAELKRGEEYQVFGDFLYSVEYYDADGNRVIEEKGVRSGIMIMGLSEAGKEKKTIVVPEYINGMKVEQLGYSKIWSSEGEWESEKLKKLIICNPVPMTKGIFGGCINLEKIILLMHDKYDDYGGGYIPVYLTSYHYSEEYITNYFKFRGGDLFFSNVSFMYNFENAPQDGYYWIDDCDYGSRIDYIPELPVREGYAFDGWYMQPECIDEWDFETDTLPHARYTEENEEIYQETRLYAKWIKN